MKLTRREFLMASAASGGMLISGLPMAQTKAQPKTSAMALRKAQDWYPATLRQSLH